MVKFALGIIETFGLVAAIEAADTAVKSANVKLLGYELTKGGGLVTVKFAGDVGAVKAAVESASISASKVNRIWSKLVIPRPHDEIEKLIKNSETVGNDEKVKKSENNVLDITEKELDKSSKKDEEIKVINIDESKMKKEKEKEDKNTKKK